MWLKLFRSPLNKANAAKAAIAAAILQAAYVGLIVWLMSSLSQWFSDESTAEKIAPFFMLTLLVVSVGLSGLIIFGYPLYIILEHKRYRLAIFTLVLTFLILLIFAGVGLTLFSGILT